MKKHYMVTINSRKTEFYQIGCESWGGIPLGIRKKRKFVYGVMPEKYFRFKTIAKFYMLYITIIGQNLDFEETLFPVLHEVQQ